MTSIPTNHAPFSLEEVLVATSGRPLRPAGALRCCGVSTDSRTTGPDNLFVALVGERFDGHDHLHAAAEKGATMALVSRPADAPAGLTLIQVEDTTRALGDLARAHRRRWAARSAGLPRRVVAITGSAGKTTTRRTTAALLRALGASVHASTGNLNNAIGVPMVLLGLTDAHDIAVVEIGTSSPGEIAYGASIAEPDVALLTLVALAHSERLGGLRGVAEEKGALLRALPPGGVAIVNGDDDLARAQLLRSPSRRWIHYGMGDAMDVRVTSAETLGADAARIELALRGPVRHEPNAFSSLPVAPAALRFEAPLLGLAGAYAAAAAVAVGCVLAPERLASSTLTEAFSALGEEGGRLVPVRLDDGTLVLDDSYNANRASMVASIQLAAQLAKREGRRLGLVLGEMRELGEHSGAEHAIVGLAAATSGAAYVVTVTGDARTVGDALTGEVDIVHVDDARAAVEVVRARVRAGDVLLVKGSRSIGLERVVEALRFPGASPITH